MEEYYKVFYREDKILKQIPQEIYQVFSLVAVDSVVIIWDRGDTNWQKMKSVEIHIGYI